MYQPTVGRFFSVDPLSPDGVDVIPNLGWFGERLEAMKREAQMKYGYCANNPVRWVDPSGEQVEKPPRRAPVAPTGRITVNRVASNYEGQRFKCIPGDAEFEMEWDFTLVPAAKCDGHIVQRVDLHCEVWKCDDLTRLAHAACPTGTITQLFFCNSRLG